MKWTEDQEYNGLSNLEIDDILLYVNSYDWNAVIYERHTIYDKIVTDSTIKYLSHVLEEFHIDPEPTYIEYSDQSLIFSSNEYFLDYPLDNEINGTHDWHFFKDSIFNNIPRQVYCTSVQSYELSCTNPQCFLPTWAIGGYAYSFEDLGTVFTGQYNDSDSPQTEYQRSLIAYKKGNEIYGDPYQITSLNELTENQIQVYPNPSNGTVSFEIDLDQFEIFELNGKRVLVGQGKQADLSSLQNGIYLLKAFKGGQFYSQKIIKQ